MNYGGQEKNFKQSQSEKEQNSTEKYLALQ